MTSDELRTLQAPFKERYRSNAASALATLSARGRVDFDKVTVQLLNEGPDRARTGLHPLTGGDGLSACAAEMLLEALVGCAGVTFAAVCTSLQIPVEEAELTAAAEIDFRGTLGVDRGTPVGFQNMRLEFAVASNAGEESLSKAVQLAERYCVVAQSLKEVHVSWKRK